MSQMKYLQSRGYKNRSHTNLWYVPLSNLVDKEIGFRQKLYKPFQSLWLGLCTQFFFQGSLIGNLELSAMGPHKVLGHRSNSLSAGIGTCKHEQGQHSKSNLPCYCWKYYCNCSGKSTQHHPNLSKFPQVAECLQAWLAVNHMLGVTICWVSGKHCPNWPSCRIRRCWCSN